MADAEQPMVERVARALRRSHTITDYGRGTSSDDGWEAEQDAARANIAAMREPSEAMMAAGDQWMIHGRANGSMWKAMIDAALAEPPTGASA